MKLHKCYEDDYIIAIHKPNNVLVHHSSMAANMACEKTFIALISEQFNDTYFPIHRLDRKTSGIILCAKKRGYVAPFQALFNTNKINKIYYGIVRGFIPEKGCIDSPVKGRDAKVYKDACTIYKRLDTATLNIAIAPYNKSRYSLVELQPKTGRLHQLRIHLNKISHPLIGDPKYGDRHHNNMFKTQFNCNTLLLHAKQISFTHPFTKKVLDISAPLPNIWTTLNMQFKWDLIS